MAPAYANLFMDKIERKLQSLSDKIRVWRRYIDDIFFLWIGTRAELNKFMRQANAIHPTIKFTHEVDENKL